MKKKRVEIIPADRIEGSAIYVVMEAPMPGWFWEHGDPSEEVLLKIHKRLRSGGWGRENIDTIYSYFQEAVEPTFDLPKGGFRKRWGEAAVVPDARFWVWLDSAYLIENPRLLEDLPRLRGEGFIIDWRISADRGPLKGEEWGPGTMIYDYFVVGPPERE